VVHFFHDERHVELAHHLKETPTGKNKQQKQKETSRK
jgi:hypothetical protein